MTRLPVSIKRRTLIVAGACGISGLLLGGGAAGAHGLASNEPIAASGYRAVISGRVLTVAGVPLANAMVTFRYADAIAHGAASERTTALARVSTDADGRFCTMIDSPAGARALDCHVGHGALASVCRVDSASDTAASSGHWDESGIRRSALQIQLA